MIHDIDRMILAINQFSSVLGRLLQLQHKMSNPTKKAKIEKRVTEAEVVSAGPFP